MEKAPILRDRLVITVLVALALTCSSGEQGNDEPADVPAEASVEATSDGSPETTDAEAATDVAPVERLEFVDLVGDDHVSCVGTDTCTLLASIGFERAVQVRYTVGGEPVAGVTVAFDVLDDPSNLVRLSVDSIETNDDGIATVFLRFPFSTDLDCTSSYDIQASLPDHPSVAPLTFLAKPNIDCSINYLPVSIEAVLWSGDYGETRTFLWSLAPEERGPEVLADGTKVTVRWKAAVYEDCQQPEAFALTDQGSTLGLRLVDMACDYDCWCSDNDYVATVSASFEHAPGTYSVTVACGVNGFQTDCGPPQTFEITIQ